MTISYNFYSLINAFIPLFIISFFLLDSMFNVNIKGLVLIIGLCINIIVTIIIGNSLNIPTNDNNNLVCSPFNISNVVTFNKLPLNTTILSFVLSNLFAFSVISGNTIINIPFFIIMSLLIFADEIYG